MTTDRVDNKTFLALAKGAENDSIKHLIPLLADTLFMYALYKKYHWHVEGEDFYEYHLLFDKHADEQLPIADLIAERIRTLGGRAPGMPADIENNKTISEPNDPGIDGQKMINNLCIVHENIIKNLRIAAEATDKNGDAGTNDLIVSDALRVHELQLWFIRSCLSKK
jgi:starvation-inducible DNA-binding protein